MFFVRLYSWLGLPNVRHFCRGPAPWRSNPPWGWDHMGSLRGWVVVLPKSLEYVFFKVGIIDIALQQIKNIMRQNAEKNEALFHHHVTLKKYQTRSPLQTNCQCPMLQYLQSERPNALKQLPLASGCERNMKNGAFLRWIKVSNGEISGLLDNITNYNKDQKKVEFLED